jgi:hypothetical protein
MVSITVLRGYDSSRVWMWLADNNIEFTYERVYPEGPVPWMRYWVEDERVAVELMLRYG